MPCQAYLGLRQLPSLSNLTNEPLTLFSRALSHPTLSCICTYVPLMPSLAERVLKIKSLKRQQT